MTEMWSYKTWLLREVIINSRSTVCVHFYAYFSCTLMNWPTYQVRKFCPQHCCWFTNLCFKLNCIPSCLSICFLHRFEIPPQCIIGGVYKIPDDIVDGEITHLSWRNVSPVTKLFAEFQDLLLTKPSLISLTSQQVRGVPH